MRFVLILTCLIAGCGESVSQTQGVAESLGAPICPSNVDDSDGFTYTVEWGDTYHIITATIQEDHYLLTKRVMADWSTAEEGRRDHFGVMTTLSSASDAEGELTGPECPEVSLITAKPGDSSDLCDACDFSYRSRIRPLLACAFEWADPWLSEAHDSPATLTWGVGAEEERMWMNFAGRWRSWESILGLELPIETTMEDSSIELVSSWEPVAVESEDGEESEPSNYEKVLLMLTW